MGERIIQCPAKINLYLAVTGRRPDGFHDLVSVVAPLTWGDSLEIAEGREFSLTCEDPAVPAGDENLVFKAARAFRAATGWNGGAHFRLEKRIPTGAGLGGGSSDAAAALEALNGMSGGLLTADALSAVAAQVGSDCPLFLRRRAVVVRGRGERIDLLDEPAAARLRGRRVLLFMPSFRVSTPWAYGELAKMNSRTGSRPSVYVEPAEAEGRLATWSSGSRPVEDLLFNSLEAPVFRKYPALPVLVTNLRRDFGFAAAMTGSGSCCYALLPEDVPAARVHAAIASIRDAIGSAAFVLESQFG